MHFSKHNFTIFLLDLIIIGVLRNWRNPEATNNFSRKIQRLRWNYASMLSLLNPFFDEFSLASIFNPNLNQLFKDLYGIF